MFRINEINTNLLALSSFGLSIAHFCFSLRFGASDICFHISGHNVSGLDVVRFLVSLRPDHVYPSGGFSLNMVNLVKPIHISNNSRFPSTFLQSSTFSPTSHLWSCWQFWWRQCVSVECGMILQSARTFGKSNFLRTTKNNS